jgi:Ca2+-dependent lipid-binding protein
VFASHFVTRFGGGFGWLFVVIAFCSSYYSISMERFRQQSRDDVQRELVKTRLESESESADWINHFLDRFWLIYEPILSATIVASVDQVLSASTPPMLESLNLSTFTLGTKAPHIDEVRTFPKTPDDIITMDWTISFTPNDISDVTPRELLSKVNPKIVLAVKIGKGIVTGTIPILLEDITFKGKMRIRLKLMSPFPHIQIVDLSFLEKPIVDFVLRPLGNFDISNIPGLQPFIQDTIHATLGPMMYEPNVFTLNLEQMLSGTPLDTAIGVLQVTVDNATGLKGGKIGGGTPDPYISMSINRRTELAKTKYKHSTYNPSWHETKFILVNSLTEQLVLSLYDYNDHRKDTLLGEASFDLSELVEDATRENLETPFLLEGKDRGHLRYHVSFYPVLKAGAIGDSGEMELPETNVGIVRLTLHQAKELDQSKTSIGDLNPFARVFLGDNHHAQFSTRRLKHTNAPVWEESTEFLCSDKDASVITIKVVDDRDFLKDPVIGYMSVRLADLLVAKSEAGHDWWPLSHCKSGRVRLTAEWKPLNMAGSLHGAEAFTAPIGVVRLWLQKAVDVKNVEATLGGKSDPYVRVQVSNETRGRTEVINNNLNPEWDQILYIPVHTLRENLFLECMDYQHLTKDRTLGHCEVRVSELAKESGDLKYPYASIGKKAAKDPLRFDKGVASKGTLHYVAEFIPALALNGVRFDGVKNEVQRAVEDGQGDEDGSVVDEDGSGGSDDEFPQGVTATTPMGVTHKKSGSVATTNSVATANTTGTAVTADSKKATSQKSGASKKDKGVNMTKEQLLATRESLRLLMTVFVPNKVHRQSPASSSATSSKAGWPSAVASRSSSTTDPGLLSAPSSLGALTHGGTRLARASSRSSTSVKFGCASTTMTRARRTTSSLNGRVTPKTSWPARLTARHGLRSPARNPTRAHPRWKLRPGSSRCRSTWSPAKVSTVSIHVPLTTYKWLSISTDQGMLRVELVEGRDILAADRGGKSDPFAVFSLNGQKVFKSQTKKKTLNPEWNETFVIGVVSTLWQARPSYRQLTRKQTSRVAAQFQLEVLDWNQIEQSKSLGTAWIQLDDLEPFQGVERIVRLSNTRHGEKGEIRMRLTFTPEVIYKTRQKTSTFSSATFSTAGRAMTQIGGMPVGVGKGVAGGVGKVFRKDHVKNSPTMDSALDVVVEPPSGPPPLPNGSPPRQAAVAMFPSTSKSSIDTSPAEPGTLRVTIIDGNNVSDDGDPVKPYVTVRVADKEQKTKHVGKTTQPEWCVQVYALCRLA